MPNIFINKTTMVIKLQAAAAAAAAGVDSGWQDIHTNIQYRNLK